MKKFKVTAPNNSGNALSIEDLIYLHQGMMACPNVSFDVHCGSIVIDGKSLLALLGIKRVSFEIWAYGESEKDLYDFYLCCEKYLHELPEEQ